jgi:hypothetical protein
MNASTSSAKDEFADPEAITSEDEEATLDEFAGYEAAGKLGDIDDAPKRTIIAEGTLVTLGIAGFKLFDRKKGSECISLSLEVVAPQEFVGDETNFRPRFYLKTQVKEGSTRSAWQVSASQIGRMVCGVYQKGPKDPAVANFLDPAFLAVAGIEDRIEKKVAFHAALVDLLNEELKGKTFSTKIGIDPAKGVYKRRQSIGYVQYPGCRDKDAD